MVMALVLAMTGCKGEEKGNDPTAAPTPTQVPAPTATTAPTEAPKPTTPPTPTPKPEAGPGFVVDFEDGKTGFVMVNAEPLRADKEASFELVDYNGSKAVKVNSVNGKMVTYLGIDASSLLGSKITDVRSIDVDLAVEVDGKFYAASGNIVTWVGDGLVEHGYPWSVYMPDKNPKTATAEMRADRLFIEGAKNIVVISKETDNKFTDIGETTAIYVDNIIFRDANGNPIAVDTGVSFDTPKGFGGPVTDGGGPFSANAKEVMVTLDWSGTNVWQYPLSNFIGTGTIKQIIIEFVGPFIDEGGNAQGNFGVGLNAVDGWWQVDFEIYEPDSCVYVIPIPADVAIDFESGGIIQVGYWWGTQNTCTITKIEFDDGSAPKGGPFSANAKEVMVDLDWSGTNVWQYPLSNFIGTGTVKQIIIEFVGPFIDEGGNAQGNFGVGLNAVDGWWQVDFEIYEPDSCVYVIPIPADVEIDFEGGGIIQVGYWWGTQNTCTITKIEFDDGSAPSSSPWSANAIAAMREMDQNTEDGKMYYIPLSSLKDKGQPKQVIFQLVGKFDELGYLGGMGSLMFDCVGDVWWQEDYAVTDPEENTFIFDIPPEDLFDFDKEGGNLAIGYWWGASADGKCILTYVDFVY